MGKTNLLYGTHGKAKQTPSPTFQRRGFFRDMYMHPTPTLLNYRFNEFDCIIFTLHKIMCFFVLQNMNRLIYILNAI